MRLTRGTERKRAPSLDHAASMSIVFVAPTRLRPMFPLSFVDVPRTAREMTLYQLPPNWRVDGHDLFACGTPGLAALGQRSTVNIVLRYGADAGFPHLCAVGRFKMNDVLHRA